MNWFVVEDYFWCYLEIVDIVIDDLFVIVGLLCMGMMLL